MSRMRRCYVFLLLLLAVTAGLAACGGDQPAPTPTAPPPTQPPQPAPAGWVEFSFPPENGILPNPVIVEGVAGPGARVVRIQIKDTTSTLLGEQVVTFSEPSDSSRGFSVQIYYSSPGQRVPGIIEAYFNESSQPVNDLSVVLNP